MHPGSPPGGVSTPSAYAASTAARSGAPRQPAGVGVSTVSVRGDDADITDVHPGSPPVGSSTLLALGMCTRRAVHPAARRGGSLNFTRAGGTLMTGTCTPAARRGGSLNIQMTCSMSAAFAVHPGSPPGGSLNSVSGVGLGRSVCTPAARRVGVSTSPRNARADTVCVHPGSPPGGSSQLGVARRQPDLPEVRGSPPGWGISTSRRRRGRIDPRPCTPAARRGGSLNFANDNRSVSGRVHPAARRGGSLNMGPDPVGGCRRAPGSPPGGSLN